MGMLTCDLDCFIKFSFQNHELYMKFRSSVSLEGLFEIAEILETLSQISEWPLSFEHKYSLLNKMTVYTN